jgi:Tfp pilus assembly protein PilF
MFAQNRPASGPALEAGRTAMRQHNFGEAVRLLEEGLKQFPEDRNLKFELGRAYLYNRQDDQAVRLFREILREEPSHRMAKLELARALGYHRDYASSTRLYREMLASDPNDEAASIGLIRNLIRQKQTAEARRELNRALARHPDSARLHEYKTRLNRAAGKGRQGPRERREPPPAGSKKRGQLRGTGAYLSDSAGNHSWRATQEFEHGFTRNITTRLQSEERRLWNNWGPRANVLWATQELRLRLSPAMLVSGRGGAVRFADGQLRALYGGDVQWHAAPRFWVTAGFLRRPISPTFRSTAFNVLANDWRAGLRWYPRNWRVNALFSHGNYSDANSGQKLTAEALKWMGPAQLGFAAGYRFNHIGFRENLLHGYFSPSNYNSHLGLTGVRFRLGKVFRAEYLGGLGVESISAGTYHAAWQLALRNRWQLGNWEIGGDYFYFRLALERYLLFLGVSSLRVLPAFGEIHCQARPIPVAIACRSEAGLCGSTPA